MTPRREEEERRVEWHLDRRVTLALIFGVLLHGSTTVWWAARLQSTVESHAEKLALIDRDFREQRVATKGVDARLTRLEERIVQQTELLQEVRRLLSQPPGVGAR